MFWNSERHQTINPASPTTASHAADLLDDALDEIEAGYRFARDLPVVEDMLDGGMKFHFTKPPKDRHGGVGGYEWDGRKISITMPDIEPQTFYWRRAGEKWTPVFHDQLRENIRGAVAYLAKVCERHGWAADPLDRLLAWSTGTLPFEDQDVMQAVHLLIAKVRRMGDADAAGRGADGERATGKRRRSRIADDPALTERQRQAMTLYGEMGSTVRVADAMGIKHPSASRLLQTAKRKLGVTAKAAYAHRTRSLPQDHRGQISVSDDDDSE